MGGRSGAFADAENWNPPAVPIFEEGGRCDTAIVEGGRNVTIDLAAEAAAAARRADPLAALDPRAVVRKVARLVVRDSQGLRTTGGSLEADALSPEVGERSLEIGDNASLLLEDAALVARHVAIGTSGAGEIDVAGLGGFLETGGRLGLGVGGDGRLVVRDGATVSSAETVLGETAGQGSALVQGAASLWQTGNLAVGLEADASIIVEAGGLLQSDEAYIDRFLAEDERARVIVQGKDGAGTPSRWELASLDMATRGALEVADGGVVEIAGELKLIGSAGDCARPVNCVLLRDGRVAAQDVTVLGGEIRVEPAGRLVAESVTVEDPLNDAQRSCFSARRRRRSSRRLPSDVAKRGDASISSGRARGARAVLRGGGREDSDGYLALLGDGPGPDADAPRRPRRPGNSTPSSARSRLRPPASVSILRGCWSCASPAWSSRALAHDLFIQRLGLLESGEGELSIQAPGRLVNEGVVRGGLMLEGNYVQRPQGTYELGSILSCPAAPRRARSSPAATGFPRRAPRAKPALRPPPARRHGRRDPRRARVAPVRKRRRPPPGRGVRGARRRRHGDRQLRRGRDPRPRAGELRLRAEPRRAGS